MPYAGARLVLMMQEAKACVAAGAALRIRVTGGGGSCEHKLSSGGGCDWCCSTTAGTSTGITASWYQYY
jgi:hypothetical protein